MSSAPSRVGVVGGTGYAGAELVRLLLGLPEVELAAVTSRSKAGQPLASVHPALAGFTDQTFCAGKPSELAGLDAVFLAVPHGTATEWAEELDSLGCERIIDLSADHRHAEGWVYGQAEWHAEAIEGARRIAVPGCFATAISLALAPLVKAGLGGSPVQCVAATGSTGSGITPSSTTHHPERFVNLKAYKVLTHQHTPEIETFLKGLGSFERLHFVPLSAPIDRGILATCFVTLPQDSDGTQAEELVARAYASHPLVRVRTRSPELRHVRGSALCDLVVRRDGDQLVVLSAIDNLGKGAAAHAIQCFNLAAGRPAHLGLGQIPCLP